MAGVASVAIVNSNGESLGRALPVPLPAALLAELRSNNGPGNLLGPEGQLVMYSELQAVNYQYQQTGAGSSDHGEQPAKKKARRQPPAELPEGPRVFRVSCGQVRNRKITVEGVLTMENVVNRFLSDVSTTKTATTLRVQDTALYHQKALVDEAKWRELLVSHKRDVLSVLVVAKGYNLLEWNRQEAKIAGRDLLGCSESVAACPRYAPTDFPSQPLQGSMKLQLDPFAGVTATVPPTGHRAAPEGQQTQGDKPIFTTLEAEVERVLKCYDVAIRVYEIKDQMVKAEVAHRYLMDNVWQVIFMVAEQLWPNIGCETLEPRLLRYQAEYGVSGTLSWGKLDWVILYNGNPALLIGAKGRVRLEEMWPQLYASIAAVRDMLLNRPAAANGDVKLIKEKNYQASSLSQLPTFSCLCQADKYVLVKYVPPAGTQPATLVSKTLSLDLLASRSRLREQLYDLISHCVGSLLEQLKALKAMNMEAACNMATDEDLDAADDASLGNVQWHHTIFDPD